jgi:hypothetical protein
MCVDVGVWMIMCVDDNVCGYWCVDVGVYMLVCG